MAVLSESTNTFDVLGGETVGLKGKASIPTDDLIPLFRRCRNHHSLAYQVPIANTDIY